MPRSATPPERAGLELEREPRDWERAYADIWAHPSSLKMLRGTRRQLPAPVIEICPPAARPAFLDLGTVAAVIALCLIAWAAL